MQAMQVDIARVDSSAYHARDHDKHALRGHANDQLQLTARYPHNHSCQSYKNNSLVASNQRPAVARVANNTLHAHTAK